MNEDYKYRQQVLKAAGYNVPQDGSWGPWQENLWQEFNSREKEYPTTVWGLLQKGIDTITGNTTYQNSGHTLTRVADNTRELNPKRQQRRYNNYFDPIWGAGQRWKASMRSGSNVFQGFGRTIVPAVTGAAAVTYVPQVVAQSTKAVPEIAKTVVKHPRLVSKVAKSGAIDFGKKLVKGIVGGFAVDALSEMFSSKDWSHLSSEYTGISPKVTSWLNPGYLFGGIKLGISPNDKTKLLRQAYRAARKNYHNELFKKEQLERELENIRLDRFTADDLYNKMQQKYWTITNTASDKKFLASLKRPFKGKKRQSLISRQNNNRELLSDEIPRTDVISRPYYQIQYPNANSKTQYNVTFTDPAGNVATSPIDVYTAGDNTAELTSVYYTLKNGQFDIVEALTNRKARFGNTIEGNTKEIQDAISKYVNDLQNVMGADGVVAGSLIHYKNGVLKGTESASNYIGPADTEIYTTQDRLQNLINKLQFTQNWTNSTGGRKGVSPFTFRNNSGNHSRVDTEINIIEADQNGYATGKIAHQIYRALYPEKYSQFVYDQTMSKNLTNTSNLSLPITAEELLHTLQSNPEAMQTHLLVDLVGMETFTNGTHTKATKRLFSMLFDPDEKVQQRLSKALNIHGRYNLGSNFKSGTELYPNLSFSDIDANKQFLQQVYKLTEEEADRYARNINIMRNAFNLYNFSMSTGTRSLMSDILTAEINGVPVHDPKLEMFYANGSLGGGNFSGQGLNTTLLNPGAGWGSSRDLMAITQRPITYYPDKITKPTDLIQQVEHLTKIDQSPFHDWLASHSPGQHTKYDMQAIKENFENSVKADAPMILDFGSYGFAYAGGFARPIASGARIVNGNDTPELGSLLKDIQNNSNQTTTESVLNLPGDIQRVLTEIKNKTNEQYNFLKNEWKTGTPRDRAMKMRYQNRTIKFKLSDNTDVYNRFSINGYYRNPQSRIYDYNNNRDASDIIKKIYYGDTNNYPEISTEAHKEWTDLMKDYKKLKQEAYNSNIKAKVYKQAFKRAAKLKDNTKDKYFEHSHQLYLQNRKLDLARNKKRNASWEILRNISDRKERFKTFAIIGGLSFPIFGLPAIVNKYRRNSSQKKYEEGVKQNKTKK